jgi:hypothetical protein
VAAVVDAAELLQEPIAEDQELAHRLGGVTGLRDHVEGGLVEVDLVEDRGDARGVDVVGDEHAGAVGRPRAELGEGRPEGPGQGANAERRAADPDDDERVEFAAHLVGEGLHALEVALLVRQLAVALPPGPPVGLERGVDLRDSRGERLEVLLGESGGADQAVERAVHVDANRHLGLPAPAAAAVGHVGPGLERGLSPFSPGWPIFPPWAGSSHGRRRSPRSPRIGAPG